MGIAATAVAIGLAVIASGVHVGWQGLHGVRLIAFLVGALAFATATYLLQRTFRRRARLDAIADLLPNYRHYRRHADELFFDEPELDDELSARLPVARGEVGSAARALLVSLEDEMRRDTVRMRRNNRPHCRQARLRTAGRSESRRRRIPVRFATTPS